MKAPKGFENPYHPAPYEAKHVTAVQQLAEGKCPEHLQKEFLDWLINAACGTYDQSFRIDPYLTAFAEGKRHVGNSVVKMLKLNPAEIRRGEEHE